jgi:hypothetical protein
LSTDYKKISRAGTRETSQSEKEIILPAQVFRSCECEESMGAMQRYVSKELTHFVGRNLREVEKDVKQRREEQYKILLKIIEEKCISSSPHYYPDQITPGLKYNATSRNHVVPLGKFSSNDMIVPSALYQKF